MYVLITFMHNKNLYKNMMCACMLSCLSRVQLCETL